MAGQKGRLRRPEIVAALRSSSVFYPLAKAQLEAVAAVVETVAVPGGGYLLRQGEAGDALFVVVHGRLRVVVEAEVEDDHDTLLEEVGPGGVVGEVSLLGGQPRGASVRAVRDSVLLRLDAAAFHNVVRRDPDALLAITNEVVRRLTRRDAHLPVATPVRTIALLPAGSRPPDLRRVSAALVRALKRLGSATVVRPALVDNSVGRGAAEALEGQPREPRLLAFLNGIEQAHDYVVYEAEPDATPWSRRCVRQADRVLVVGNLDSSADPGPLDDLLEAIPRASRPRTELLLFRAPGTRPAGTAAWLADRPRLAVHHAVTGDARDLERVARLVCGRAVGLALGGGGPRGFAHLGVLRALEEHGITIDAIAGTSMGAMMAATYAIGWDDATRVAKSMAGFVETKRLIGYTLPLVSLSSSRTITRALRNPNFFGETQIEDLPLRAMFVSANLSKAEVMVHERGPVWLALRASASMPGVLPPVWLDGDLLVDGGVLDDVPVETLRSRMEGRVIAVDLEPAVELRAPKAFPPDLSGWRVLWQRVNPFGASMHVPGPVRVMLRAKEIGGRRAQRAQLEAHPPDLLLHPPVGRFDPLDFRGAPAIIEVGYRHASEVLEASGGIPT